LKAENRQEIAGRGYAAFGPVGVGSVLGSSMEKVRGGGSLVSGWNVANDGCLELCIRLKDWVML